MYDIKVSGYFCSIYSKISALPLPQIKYGSVPHNSVVNVPYHQLVSKKLAYQGFPAVKSEPEFHNIGGLVLILKTMKTGFIVGIDDHSLFVQTAQELVKVGFLDVFNSKWAYYLQK